MSLTTQAVNVGTSPTRLTPASASSVPTLSIGVQNTGSVDVALGDSNVTMANGWKLAPGEKVIVDLSTRGSAPRFPVVHEPDGDITVGGNDPASPYTVSGVLYAVAASAGTVNVLSAPGPGGIALDGLTQDEVDARVTAVGNGAYAPVAGSQRYRNVPQRVADLQYPAFFWHRGGANLFPENTPLAFKSALALGGLGMNPDVTALSDGSLICMHDTTLDRTTSGTGNVAALDMMGAARLAVDAPTWFCNNVPNQTIATWEEFLVTVGGQAVISPEVKDMTDETATRMAQRLNELGLGETAIVQSFTRSNLEIVAEAGIATMMLLGSVPDQATIDSLAAAGIWSVGISYNLAGLADLCTALHAAGMKAFAFTLDSQHYADQMIADGFDGIITNDPVYVARDYAKYRKTATSWNKTGTFSHGMIVHAADGPYGSAQRGKFVGVEGAWRWQLASGGGQVRIVPGEVCPIANAASSYNITVTFGVDVYDSGNNNQGLICYYGSDSDYAGTSGTDVTNCYSAKFRQNGKIDSWINNPNPASAGASVSTTVPTNVTTTAALASGTAITAIPVQAIPRALLAGHQFYLPNGQVATVATGGAASGATSIPVNSITPSALVPSGSVLIQRITMKLAVTPTQITVSRPDEPTATPLVISDATFRGGYIYLSWTDPLGGLASIESVTIS